MNNMEYPAPPSTRTFRRVNEILLQEYGHVDPTPRDPLDGLIVVILSQATNDVNCDRAFRNLKVLFPTWTKVLLADTQEIADAIRCGGLANQKAARIKKLLQEIYDDQGNLDLSWMRTAPPADVRAYMEKFHGVGPKTISVVQMFFLGQPAFAVDVHIHRVTRRLGWVPLKSTPTKAQEILEKAMPDDVMLDLHINLIALGRAICRADGNGGPQCPICPINRFCNYYKEHRKDFDKSTFTKQEMNAARRDFFVTIKRRGM
jgi:endonuclease-3